MERERERERERESQSVLGRRQSVWLKATALPISGCCCYYCYCSSENNEQKEIYLNDSINKSLTLCGEALYVGVGAELKCSDI